MAYIYVSTKFKPNVLGHACLRELTLSEVEAAKIKASHIGWGGLFTPDEFRTFVAKQSRGALRSCLMHLGVQKTSLRDTAQLKARLIALVLSNNFERNRGDIELETSVPESEGSGDNGVDADGLTVAQLKDLLDQMGIQYTTRATKAQLLDLLEQEPEGDDE